MKNPFLFLTIIITLFLTSCSQENISTEDINTLQKTNLEPKQSNERRIPINLTGNLNLCFSTKLIANEHHVAGKVSIYKDDGKIILTYTTKKGWKIKATHLSIGTLGEHEFPVTKSGNAKIGEFEYKSKDKKGTSYVQYTFNDTDFDDAYWFAAHAVVVGPNGEGKAWAKGKAFEGNKKKNNWAMSVIANKNKCK